MRRILPSQFLIAKMQNCLVDYPQTSIKDLEEKAERQQTAAGGRGGSSADQSPVALAKRGLAQLLMFDQVSDDLAKFANKCENLIASGSVTSMFKKK